PPLGSTGCAVSFQRRPGWTNPPHRSHLCAGCGFTWRPADVPTNGVAAIKTRGRDDDDVPANAAPASAAAVTDEQIKATIRKAYGRDESFPVIDYEIRMARDLMALAQPTQSEDSE